MAYVEQKGPQRLVAIGAVGVIHAALGALLILGLAPPLMEIFDPPPLIATQIPLPAKLPPKPQTEKTKPDIESILTAPTPPIIFTPVATIPIEPVDVFPLIGPIVSQTARPILHPAPATTPIPAFTPTGVSPKNDMSRWATTNDYPRRAIIKSEQGISGFRVIVGSNGRVQSCEITRSSGSNELDKATCKFVKRRARFNPAINERGEKIVSSFSNAISWKLPD